MRRHILLAFFFLSFSRPTENGITEYLLTRTFHYELGVSVMHANNMEVHGKTDVSREVRFINDSVFRETIFNETRFYDTHLSDSSSFTSMKNGYEISVLKGKWVNEHDTVIILNYTEEKIFDMGTFLEYRYKTEQELNTDIHIQALRSRTWMETKRLKITDDRNLCVLNGLNRCYSPNY